MKITAPIIALAALLALPAIAVAKPPSFAIWETHREARVARMIQPVETKCRAVANLTNDDYKAGACMTSELLRIWPRSNAPFDHSVRLISAPQTAPCRRAIHTWWSAMNTDNAAILIYLHANQTVSATEFDHDLHTGTMGALSDKTDGAKANAIRVCG
jgi:hypothetical protein